MDSHCVVQSVPFRAFQTSSYFILIFITGERSQQQQQQPATATQVETPVSRKSLLLKSLLDVLTSICFLDPETDPQAPATLFFFLLSVLRLFHFKTGRHQTWHTDR